MAFFARFFLRLSPLLLVLLPLLLFLSALVSAPSSSGWLSPADQELNSSITSLRNSWAAQRGKPMLHEARYHRRGARHLFAGLSVADGQVYGTCRSRKCFVDFQAFVQQAIIPEALRRQVHPVTLILDNGTTHAPKQLDDGSVSRNRCVKSTCAFRCTGCLPMLLGWIRSKFGSVCENRKHLQPNHFPSTNALETSLSEYIAYYNQAAKPINWTYTVEKLEQKVGTHL
jgi:hypothetical protein